MINNKVPNPYLKKSIDIDIERFFPLDFAYKFTTMEKNTLRAEKTNEGYMTALNNYNLFAKETGYPTYSELEASYLAAKYELLVDEYGKWLLKYKKNGEKHLQPKSLKQYFSGFNNCIKQDLRFKRTIQKCSFNPN